MGESVKVEIEIGKVEKDMADALVKLVKAIVKEKQNVGQIAGGMLPDVIRIAGEFSQIKDEIAAHSEIALGAYLALEIEKALK